MAVLSDDPREGFRRLRVAAADGTLRPLADRYGVALVVVHGSALAPSGRPRDLDVAVWAPDRSVFDVVAVAEALSRAAGLDAVDLLDVGRADPTPRLLALRGAHVLLEDRPGRHLDVLTDALLRYADTAHLRRAQLAALGGGGR